MKTGVMGLALVGAAGLLAPGSMARGQAGGVVRRQRIETPLALTSVTRLVTGPRGHAGPIRNPLLDDCPQAANYTTYDFNSPITAYAEAGMSQGESAAVTYVLTAADFPIKLDSADVLWVTDGATVTTTTEWSITVWSGTPTAGSQIFTESSDGSILPHVVMPPGTSGTVLTFSIDPQDPSQIIIPDNGTHQFTIAFRIDHHNNQPNPCFPPSPSTNAFLAVDQDGLAQGGRNWLSAISCPLGCPAGWWTFSSYPSPCRPSGDWLMRATWERVSCAPPGACCFSNGNCLSLSPGDCTQAQGVFLGSGTACDGTSCPTGACCLPNGNCLSAVTPNACTTAGGVFRGANSTCATANCPQPSGACCLSGGGCLNLTQANCALIGNTTWAGPGTTCEGGGCSVCYANCDASTTAPVLNVADFSCFLNRFAAGDSYANCDLSTAAPVLNVQDFACFLNRFAAGCS